MLLFMSTFSPSPLFPPVSPLLSPSSTTNYSPHIPLSTSSPYHISTSLANMQVPPPTFGPTVEAISISLSSSSPLTNTTLPPHLDPTQTSPLNPSLVFV